MSRKPAGLNPRSGGLLPAALRGTKATHQPPTPNLFPPAPTRPAAPSGLNLRMGRGIPGHNSGGGEMTGC